MKPYQYYGLDYAYPSSPYARDHGMSDTGMWFVYASHVIGYAKETKHQFISKHLEEDAGRAALVELMGGIEGAVLHKYSK